MLRTFFGSLRRLNGLFLLTVFLPTSLATIYYGLIASDVYISESHFVLRSPGKQTVSGLGAILQGAGFTRATDDTYAVRDYILSRDALRELDRQFGLVKAFGSSDVDRLSRFAGIDGDDSFEALHLYYQKRVGVEVDSVSNNALLRTSAFSATDAHRMNEKLLELSENLVNQLNDRARQDMIRFAADEVASAEKRASAATLAVSAFRARKGVFDPEQQSALQLQLVSKLQDELIATTVQLAQVRALTRDNPQIPSLQKRVDSLQLEIDKETAKVAGGSRSLSSQSAEFERLALDRAFADRQLAVALTSLEQARGDALRKQLYLERIAQPSVPDVAQQPRRWRGVAVTFVMGLVAWGIAAMLLAGVREHQD